MTSILPEEALPIRVRTAQLRQAISTATGVPVVMAVLPGLRRLDFVPDAPGERAGAPGVIYAPGIGVCAYGRAAGETREMAEIYAAAAADANGAAAAAFRRAREALAATPAPQGVFAGEVALVTGAASGIGKACVASFLARGAAVAGLDINPAVVRLFDRPDFTGVVCDVTDEEAVRRALDAAVRAFGGLDMLVVNAGIFPAGCNISALQLADWQRVMHINVDSGLIMLREAHPLLQAAPRHGRVAVNGSRNVLAPGPGAAAYSCSKAALTQLARVAALEWARDGIRVNIFHAHAVFDTGIWTEDVLQARAKHYGMTVDEYKRNNLLKTEVTSHDVGELAAEMCGPLFAHTTGSQVPIDGGSDRVV